MVLVLGWNKSEMTVLLPTLLTLISHFTPETVKDRLGWIHLTPVKSYITKWKCRSSRVGVWWWGGNRNGMCCRHEKRDCDIVLVQSQVKLRHGSLFYTVSCLQLSADWRWFEERGNGVVWLAPGPATGINSRMEARAAMTPTQQGIHFSPLVTSASEKSIPAHPSALAVVSAGLPFTSL